MKDKKILIVCAVGGLLVIGGFVAWLFSSPKATTPSEANVPRVAKKAALPKPKRIASAKAKPALAKTKKPKSESDEEEDSGLSKADQKKVDSLQNALDNDNQKEVVAMAAQLVNHPNPEIRQQAVEALEWFGDKTLDSLFPFLADLDEDVRASAMNAVENGFNQMENEDTKILYIEKLMQIPNACDEGCLTMLASHIQGLDNSTKAVQTAVRIISSNKNPDAVKEMKEVYEFLTGESYTTRAAANAWCRKNDAPDGAEESAEEE